MNFQCFFLQWKNSIKSGANHGRKHSSNHTDDADDDDDDDDFGYDNENLLYDKPNQSLTSADNNHIINGKLIFVNFLLSTILLLR